MSMHSLNNIERKIKMNASVTPAEMLLVIRDLLLKIDSLQERLNGLKTPTKTRRGSSSVSKREVSSDSVHE